MDKMSKLEFKPEDFIPRINFPPENPLSRLDPNDAAFMAQCKFDAWLLKQQTVYKFAYKSGWDDQWGKDFMDGVTHEAFLVCIEEIKHVHKPIYGVPGESIILCDCGAKLKAKWEVE